MRKRTNLVFLSILCLGLLTGCKKSVKQEELHMIDDNNRTYYEVFLYSYYDGNGDGIGDINGLISKLDYINDNNPDTNTDLGCNGIWLMPIMPSTTYHKYDVIDYYNIDEEYGTIDDFKQLIDECNKRGIKVIIDLVLNHTSSKNEWFVHATDYLEKLPLGEEVSVSSNPYVDYYHFERDKADASNYYQVGNTDWYYEAVFWDQMPDLNLGSKDVRREIERIVDFWLDLGVGGFRIDAAKEFYTGATDKNIEVLTWLNDYVKSKNKDAYVVAEVWDSFGTYSQYYKSGIDSVFNFAFADGDGKISTTVKAADKGKAGRSLAETMLTVQTILDEKNPNAINAAFLGNHDTARPTGYVKYDPDKTKLMSGINLMMNGSSFIYYGEEIGMAGSGRDENKRAPMYWTADGKSGMTKGPTDIEKVNYPFAPVDEQIKDSNSIFQYVRNAVRLRNENPEIARGKIALIDEVEDGDIVAMTKTYEESTIILLYNISSVEKQITMPKEKYSYERVKGELIVDEKRVKLTKDTVILPPYSIAILK